MAQPTLLIFVKNPERGKVKTRLAQGVGEDRALQIYQALLQHTREVVLAVEARRVLFYSNFIPEADDWPVDQFDKRLQVDGDLGDRMRAAFAEGFRQSGPVVIVGSDCPQLTPRIIEEAFAQLARHDFAIGPAQDGGYYLLGMRTFQPRVFENMTWSTAEVFADTTRRMIALGATYALLPTLSDIDYQEDWERFGWPLE
ncbi:MAG: TIGR04282 family arsenosugar biosynthesis glycosyltransferase [Lewinella sp.]|nr:TIGR04282 family arsenosugar biosynthesis glycosyltransferase [Lewinella sp.]